MKKTKTTAEKSVVAKTKVKQPTATAETKTTVKQTSPTKKAPKKVQVVASKQVAAVSEVTMPERIGLTAGSIWHRLSENGPIPVAKLVRELPEEEKVIHRSIGWLALEGKITLETVSRVETISLKS